MSVTFNSNYTRDLVSSSSIGAVVNNTTGSVMSTSGSVVLPGSYLARKSVQSLLVDSIGQGTTESTLASILIPANTLGVNDGLEINILWSCTNTAAIKRLRGSFGSNVVWNFDLTTQLGFRQNFILRNRNSQSSQVVQANSSTWFAPVGSTGVQIFTINFAVDQTLNITGQFPVIGTSLNTLAVEEYSVKLI